MNLVYKSHARIEELQPGECTIHPAADATGKRWWNFWFYVFRDDVPTEREDFVVPVRIGSFTETGPGGRTWGLVDLGGGSWQVSPSINVIADGGQIHPGPHPLPSRWHQTPTIVGVPDGEAWMVMPP